MVGIIVVISLIFISFKQKHWEVSIIIPVFTEVETK